jgi:hypothetical protein
MSVRVSSRACSVPVIAAPGRYAFRVDSPLWIQTTIACNGWCGRRREAHCVRSWERNASGGTLAGAIRSGHRARLDSSDVQEAAELVGGQLAGLAVAVCGLLFGGNTRQRSRFQQGAPRSARAEGADRVMPA